MPHRYIEKLIRRVESIRALDADDINALRGLQLQLREVDSRHDIVREGDQPTVCCVLFEGVAGWYKTTGDGKRQIMALHVAGDIPDLHSLHQHVMDSSLKAFGPCRIGMVSHQEMLEICLRRPNLASAFWRMTLADGSVFREWVVNVGARQGSTRLAHLLCEQVTRCGVIGILGDDFSMSLPLSQSEIGEATGFSTVHVNRALQDLRGSGLISFEKHRLRVLNWSRLQEVADFDPTYLLLEQPFIPAEHTYAQSPV
jgi:CRP-like cAMP-binding protein